MAVVYTSGVLKARKHEKITTLTSATGLTSTNYSIDGPVGPDAKARKQLQAEEAIVTVEVADIRWTIDGTTPVVTATSNGVGHLASAGDVLTITGAENIANFKAINAVNAAGSFIRATFLFRQ